MSTISTLADAVAAHINTGTYSRPVSAERVYQPVFTLEDLKDLRVSVVPRTVGISAASRDSSIFECVIDVGLQQKLPAENEQAEIDALLDLVEEIADHLRLTRLPERPMRRGRALPTSPWCRANRWSSTGSSRAS